MPMAAAHTTPRRRSPATVAAATPSPPAGAARKPFAEFAVTFVERGMREKQLQVFKKQLQDGGGMRASSLLSLSLTAFLTSLLTFCAGRWSVNALITADGATTHVVANSWRRVSGQLIASRL